MNKETMTVVLRRLIAGCLILLAIAMIVGLVSNKLLTHQPFGWFVAAIFVLAAWQLLAWGRHARRDQRLIEETLAKHGIPLKR
jgi:putative Ca2+/H+ antiporter (TMEM165/GDT1 family)